MAVSGMGQPFFLTETTPAGSTWPPTPSPYTLTKLQRHFVLKDDIPAVGAEEIRSQEMWQSSAVPAEQAERLVQLRASTTAERRK